MTTYKKADIDKLKLQLEFVIDAFEKFSRHKMSCMKLDCFDERSTDCTCGLDQVTEQIQEMK